MIQKFLLAFFYVSIAATQVTFCESLEKRSDGAVIHKISNLQRGASSNSNSSNLLQTFKTSVHPGKSARSFERLALYFVRNDGQFDPQVKFYAVSGNTLIYFTTTGVYFSFNKIEQQKKSKFDRRLWKRNPELMVRERKMDREVIKLIPVNTSKRLRILGEDSVEEKFNYFLGNDPNKWRSNVPAYCSVLYNDAYPGIDLKFYGGGQGQLEYDIIAKPGSNPSKVKFAYEGIQGYSLDSSGNLVIQLQTEKIIQHRPRIFQSLNDTTVNIGGRFQLLSRISANKFSYRFDFGKYRKDIALIIDPVISYSTYLGGSMQDYGYAVAVDPTGSAYAIGTSLSFDFPTTPGAFRTVTTDGVEGFVTKFSPDGASLIYSTYLGGSNVDNCYSGTVDSSGSVYMACFTASSDFPTVNPFQANLNGGGDAAVTKLSPDGSSLIYSTYLGGSAPDDYAYAIAVDGNGNAYVAGETKSTDFPLQNPLQPSYAGGNYDAFITEFNTSGNNLVYSTYLGGSGWDTIFGIAVDSVGAAFVVGNTHAASDFPTTPGAFDTVCDDGTSCDDGFVSKIAPDGVGITYSTFLGGSDSDVASTVAVDNTGAAYVTGNTFSELDFPLQNPIQAIHGGGGVDAFITKLSPNGSALIYSTYLGGNDWDLGVAIALDTTGAAYISGIEYSFDFPIVDPLPVQCSLDAFVTRVTPEGDAWYYSTCLGGSFYDAALGVAVDENGTAYVVGSTLSPDFPIRNAVQPNNAGMDDAFITKLICDSINSPSVLENAGVARFTFRLCIPRTSDVTINYATSDGTAIAGEDYIATSGSLVIPAGSITGYIDVQIVDDTIAEPDEYFFLNINSADVDFGLTQVTATILDNDGLLFDDFEDSIMSWDVIKGQWNETGGSLIGTPIKNTALAFAPVPWSPSGASGCTNCTIETDMQTAGGSFNKVMLEGWYQNNANRVELIMNEEADKWIFKQRSGGVIVAKAKAVAAIVPGVTYNVILSFDGTNFNLNVNGASILTMPAAAIPFGKVGFKAKKTASIFGHIRVY